MLRFIGRMLLTVAGFAALLLAGQWTLQRDEQLPENHGNQPPTRQVTVADVIAADIPMPTRSRVSFPQLSYQQAFPDATDEPEYTVTAFHEAPMLADLDSMPEVWRKLYPEELPPVAERLPRNPAVIVGPDGIGNYGGTWRRATPSFNDLNTKIGYETFIRFDPKGRIQPDLAYRWEVTDSNRVFTFHMRKGHRWSDGHPFTVDDILWVCNTLIGSARWASVPNWMQPTDGAAQVYEEDVKDWPALAKTILAQAQGDEPTPGKQLVAIGGESLKAVLQKIADGNTDKNTEADAVGELNAAFWSADFYDARAWANIDLTGEQAKLNETGASRLTKEQLDRLELLLERADLLGRFEAAPDSLEAPDLHRLNVLLFRAAYPKLVDIARVMRVKVEAVPDENGDATHIIRFTFKKPNAIFLEKTGTFMFYRGLFETPKHIDEKLNPDGSDRVEPVDIYDWPGLAGALRESTGESTPATRMWQRFDESTQQLLSGGAANLTDAQKQQVIEAINKALRSPDYFDAAAWSDFDLKSEGEAIRAIGYTEVKRDLEKVRRYRELLIRDDLLRRVEADGLASLSDDERYQFQQFMFRAAFSGTEAEPGLVAINREKALNRAAREHPLQYTSWVTRCRSNGQYDPEHNPNPPTLKAWRIVSRRDDRTIIAVRNPYYYKVDAEGNQLPYIDAVETQVETDKQVRMLKLRSGNVDFQVRQIDFSDFTVLKQNEEIGDYEIRLWPQDYCGEVTFVPIQANQNKAFAALNEDPRFRHALSLALNRQQMIDVVFKGIGEPAQYSVPEGSPYYNAKQAHAFIKYDPDEACRLLDAMGLDKRAADGTRLMPDGQPLILGVNTLSESPLPLIEMACKYWRDIGINAQMKLRAGGTMARMSDMGILDIRVHKEGGNYFGPLLAGGYAPTHPAECPQWSKWVTYIHSGGRSGWKPPQRIVELNRLWNDVITAPNDEAKFAAWQVLAERTADSLPIIGVTTSPGKVVYVKRNFKNVPKIALAGWIAHEPGNCCPEAFFFAKDE